MIFKTAILALGAPLFVLLQQLASTNAQSFEQQQLAAAQQAIIDLIEDENEFNLAAKLVRLGFHDCVGGCDGCVDLTNMDNNGIDLPIDAMTAIVDNYSTETITRADLWVLAALTGAEISQRNDGDQVEFDMTFVGRPTCEDLDACFNGDGTEVSCTATTGPHRDMPSNDLTTDELLHYFSSNFEYSPQETVAIMGVHTIGVLSRQNSGFDGNNGWVRNENRLNNEYYRLLVGGDSPDDSLEELIDGPNWRREFIDNSDLPGIPDRFQWERNGGGGGGGGRGSSSSGRGRGGRGRDSSDSDSSDDQDTMLTTNSLNGTSPVEFFANRRSLQRGGGGFPRGRGNNGNGQGGRGNGRGRSSSSSDDNNNGVNAPNNVGGFADSSSSSDDNNGGGRGGSILMLNADMAIVRDLSGNLQENGVATCEFKDPRGDRPACPHAAATIRLAAEYSNDNELWLEDFRDAFVKMLTTGCSNTDSCISVDDETEVANDVDDEGTTVLLGRSAGNDEATVSSLLEADEGETSSSFSIASSVAMSLSFVLFLATL